MTVLVLNGDPKWDQIDHDAYDNNQKLIKRHKDSPSLVKNKATY